MARELGLGVTPWSPLHSGALSGKYTRENAGRTAQADRGEEMIGSLTEKDYAIIDQLPEIAHEAGTTSAAGATARAQGRPGGASTLLGSPTPPHHDKHAAQLHDD